MCEQKERNEQKQEGPTCMKDKEDADEASPHPEPTPMTENGMPLPPTKACGRQE
jgi:hypothetical protein